MGSMSWGRSIGYTVLVLIALVVLFGVQGF
jgi:hypothetical protein